MDAARARGYRFLAITDHGEKLGLGGASRDQLLAQRDRIRALERRLGDIELLHGAELNIGGDGSLDYDDEFLDGFDVLVASVHDRLDQPGELLTARLVAACEHPAVNVVGHPTGRRIGRRAASDVDLEALYRAAARTGTALEVNGSPTASTWATSRSAWPTSSGSCSPSAPTATGPATSPTCASPSPPPAAAGPPRTGSSTPSRRRSYDSSWPKAAQADEREPEERPARRGHRGREGRRGRDAGPGPEESLPRAEGSGSTAPALEPHPRSLGPPNGRVAHSRNRCARLSTSPCPRPVPVPVPVPCP